MTADQRQYLRTQIDNRVRERHTHMLAMGGGKGRCVRCTCPHDEYTPGCVTCRDRERLRAARGTLGRAA